MPRNRRSIVRSEANMTPQQKKQFSYARDCRNGYGEHTKSSRKNIPRHRARKHRHYRHAVRQAIASDPDWDNMQSAVREGRRDKWQKISDISLAEHVRRRICNRIRTGQQPA
jgi:hypothetical protein